MAIKRSKKESTKKYVVTVNKYRPQFGSADFDVGRANSINEAEEIIKKNSKNGDKFRIAKSGKDYWKESSVVKKGIVYGSGKNKILKSESRGKKR